ncbi:MAG TPA: hypothetical protein VND45_15285, partial [Thermoanaerobaculia bacterium]|nr:hypothetical protein [Thermoanaerobaculia bacterium]
AQDGTLAFTSVTRSSRLVAMPFDATTGAAGAPRPLLGGSQEIFSFDPSPDRNSIAFTSSGGLQEDVFVANADGTRIRQLTNDAAKDRGVTWAPDGKTLYFYSNRDGAYHIWSIHADGSGLAAVTNERDLKRVDAKAFSAPHASPDGRTLVAAMSGGVVLIHLARPLGQRVEKLAGTVGGAKWSPDGTRLIGTPAAGRRDGVAVLTLATGAVVKILDSGWWPQWLPDSRHVVFFDRASAGIIDVTTRQVTKAPLVPPEGAETAGGTIAPRVSRDGTTVYLRQTLEQGDIWMVRAARP